MKLTTALATSALALIFAGSVHASLILTPQGYAAGFTLTTFATLKPGYTGCCSGPFGVAMASNGNVIVGMGGILGARYVFPDIDGQTPETALYTAVLYPTSVGAYANAGGKAYGADLSLGQQAFLAFNDDGSVHHFLTGVNVTPGYGMWGNPINGHIIADSGAGLIDIDPLANGGLGSYTVINPAVSNGVTVSPDGLIAYTGQGGRIKGYLIATGALVYTSPLLPSTGGVAVIDSPSSALDGKLVVNDNSGNLYLLDPVTNAYYVIASGATFADYISPDLSNGTIFLDLSDIVARLGCGADCSIGSAYVGSSVPEPANVFLMVTGILLLGWGLRARRHGDPGR